MKITYLKKDLDYVRIDVPTWKMNSYSMKGKRLERIIFPDGREIKACIFTKEDMLFIYPARAITKKDLLEIVFILENKDKEVIL